MSNNKKNIFERMIHNVLGESSLSNSIKKVMAESSLSRVMKWRMEHDTGAMATARFDKPKQQAKREKYELQDWLTKNGYAYTKFDGYYQEQEMPQASREDSLLIIDINDKGNLKEVLMKLGQKYGQETVLFRPKGKDGKSVLIKTTKKGYGKETPQATGTDYGKKGGVAWSEIGGRAFGDKIDIPDSFWKDEDEETPVNSSLVKHLTDSLIKNRTNTLLDDFKPHQISAVIEMMLRENGNIPKTKSEMSAWIRKNEDPLIENLARATGAYFMSRDEFRKQQEQEEQPLPQIVAKGSEVLYNKRGRACGIKVSIEGQGSLYMKRKGSHWEISDISKEEDSDARVWEVVEKSLKKMADKEPTRFIRFMRNRAYELPSWKQTVVGESITVSGIEVNPQEIMNRVHNATEEQILSWMKNNDGAAYNRFPDLIEDVENPRPRQEKLKDAYEIVMDTLSDWLNIDARIPEIKNIVISNLKEANPIPTNSKDIRKFIDGFWGEIKHLKQL